MHICFLSAAHGPLDKRVYEKQARSLAAAGFRVTHLAPDDDPFTEERDGVTVQRYRRSHGIRGRLLQLRALYGLARDVNADWYHCNEVDSWMVGVVLKLFQKKGIVFDVHEHYPTVFAETRGLPPILAALSKYWILFLYRILTPMTDRIVLAKHSIHADFAHCADKVTTVLNYSRASHIDIAKAAARSYCTGALRVIHLGEVNKNRGWPQLVEAISLTDDVSLTFVGKFTDDSQKEFDNRVSALGLNSRIDVVPWVPYEKVLALMSECDIGIVAFQPGIQNHVYALPHKLFDYMLSGLPVIIPDFAVEIAPIVRSAGCGILVDPARPEEIAAAIRSLQSDPERRRVFGERGIHAVQEVYNWENEERKLIDIYTHSG